MKATAHVPLIIVHPNYPRGQSSAVLTSHLDLMPSLPGLAGVPEAQRREAVKDLPGHDFSGVLANAETAAPQAVRPGVLFNYVAPMTIDSGYLLASMTQLLQEQADAAPDRASTQTRQTGIPEFCFRRAVQVRALLRPCQLQYAGNARANSAQQRRPAL